MNVWKKFLTAPKYVLILKEVTTVAVKMVIL